MARKKDKAQRWLRMAINLQGGACAAAMLARIHYRHGDVALAQEKAIEAELLYASARKRTRRYTALPSDASKT